METCSDKFKRVQFLALNNPDYTYVEGCASISDRIELQHHCWLIDPEGDVTDVIWGHLPDPVYIGSIVDPNEDGSPIFTEEEVFDQLKVLQNVPAEEAS